MEPNKPARLDNILASLGYGSRREAKDLVRARRVTIDGVVVRDSGEKTLPARVQLDGAPLEDIDGLLILLHKPAGLVCSHDPREGERIYDILPPRWLNRNPVPTTIGRLDKDTTGALLITDQTTLVHRLTSPKSKLPKVYHAELDGPADPAWVPLFASGSYYLPDETEPCAPAELRLLETPGHVELTLTEGRYHQVKRMFAALERTVVKLHRVRFGDLSADHLAPGQWERLPLNRFG